MCRRRVVWCFSSMLGSIRGRVDEVDDKSDVIYFVLVTKEIKRKTKGCIQDYMC
jgi:hypothetical protein